MELKAIVLMIVKIVISIPTIIVITVQGAHGVALMGGHLDNRGSTNQSQNTTNMMLEEIDQSSLKESLIRKKDSANLPPANLEDAETIPDPSPLVVPGYNLPDNIFNKGKPFYLEKDPVTGEVDFPTKAKDEPFDDSEYEYVYDEPSSNIYDKANINRKDGNVGSHKHNDVNQLTPNFHDFLPVKYSSDKYVYPLISSSYANTKVQGNVNRYPNHKDYVVTTYKPTKTPTYVSTKYSYFNINEKATPKYAFTKPTTKGTPPTNNPPTLVYLTTELNLINSPMNHQSFQDDFSTEKTKIDEIYLTTTGATAITAATTAVTKRPLSLLEQLFGPYDDIDATTTKPTHKINEDEDDYNFNVNGHAGPYNQNILTGSNMAHYEYEYEDGVTDNIAVENQPVVTEVYVRSTSSKPQTTEAETTKSTATITTTTTRPTTTTSTTITTTATTTTPRATTTTPRPTTTTPTPTTTTPRRTTTTSRPTTTIKITHPTNTKQKPNESVLKAETLPTKEFIKPTSLYPPFTHQKVTSMPLGDYYNNQPIIVTTQHLRDQLNNEKVIPKPFEPTRARLPPVPSSSSIRIPADQNTISFVVGNQQNVGNDYVGFKESPFDNKPFRPLFSQEQLGHDTVTNYQVQSSINLNQGANLSSQPFNIGASSMMHAIKNSETSLAIGVPVDMIQKKPGQVVDASLVIHSAQIEFPKANGPKIVFPDQEEKEDKQTYNPNGESYIPEEQIYTDEAESYKSDEQKYKSEQQNQIKEQNYKIDAQNYDLNEPNYNRQHYNPTSQQNEHDFIQNGPNYNLNEQDYKPDSQTYKFDGQNLNPNLHIYKSEAQTSSTTITNANNIRKNYNQVQNNKEILKLNSKPMLHQLPSDLTPPWDPSGKSETFTRVHMIRERPPWDPRPGHFHAGRPEYARPPRPNEVYKRIDSLPNILPQFRPNMKPHYFEHRPNKGYARQPLLERPSNNRPIGFFEKLQPPPLPKNIHNLRKVQPLEMQNQQEIASKHTTADDRIISEGYKKTTPEYLFYQTPPKVVLAQRRNSDPDVEIETLQMIQAKQDKDDNEKEESSPIASSSSFETNLDGKDKVEKPIYVVYPVNTGPLKMDVIDSNKKETVVIGKRAELPLPPSQIQEFDYEQPESKPQFDFDLHERHDSPILKPHPKPNFPSKVDFPYPLERPDPSLISTPEVGNNIDGQPKLETNNWDGLVDSEPRIVTDAKANSEGQISVKLKTYTEKPIAVAYTPTEPNRNDKYSLPNYASPVIPEIRNPNLETSEIIVSTLMHTNPNADHDFKTQIFHDKYSSKQDDISNTAHLPQLDFQAPFQASVSVDNMSNNGWSVVRDKSKQEDIETTTQPIITTSKFDIENFNPPLIGGFKPIYSFPGEDYDKQTEIKERQE